MEYTNNFSIKNNELVEITYEYKDVVWNSQLNQDEQYNKYENCEISEDEYDSYFIEKLVIEKEIYLCVFHSYFGSLMMIQNLEDYYDENNILHDFLKNRKITNLKVVGNILDCSDKVILKDNLYVIKPNN